MQKCVGMMKGETNTSGGHKHIRVCKAICALHDHAMAHVSALHKCVCTRKKQMNATTASAAQERRWK